MEKGTFQRRSARVCAEGKGDLCVHDRAVARQAAHARLYPIVGITGDTSEQDLHKRYARYLLDYRNEEGRPAVYYMLENWWGDLFFNFVPMPNQKVDLARIEKAFINAVMPPINKRDLEARISAPRAAAF